MYATLSISHTVRNVCACYVSSQQQPGRPGWRVKDGSDVLRSYPANTAQPSDRYTFSTFIDNYINGYCRSILKSVGKNALRGEERDCVPQPARRHSERAVQARDAHRLQSSPWIFGMSAS